MNYLDILGKIAEMAKSGCFCGGAGFMYMWPMQ